MAEQLQPAQPLSCLQANPAQLAFLPWRYLYLQNKIVALALNEGRPAEVHHKTIRAASFALSERFQLGLGKVHPQSVFGSGDLNPERVEPGQRIEGDFIPDGALLQTAQRPLKAVPIKKFFADIRLALEPHLAHKQIKRQPEPLWVCCSLALP